MLEALCILYNESIEFENYIIKMKELLQKATEMYLNVFIYIR